MGGIELMGNKHIGRCRTQQGNLRHGFHAKKIIDTLNIPRVFPYKCLRIAWEIVISWINHRIVLKIGRRPKLLMCLIMSTGWINLYSIGLLFTDVISCLALQWRHNERDCAPNHQHHDYLFNRLFNAQIKENIKAPRHWPLCGEFTGDRWIPRTKGQ